MYVCVCVCVCVIAVIISITTLIIQIQAVRRVYSFQTSVLGDTRRETQFLRAYTNHNMLTPPSPHTHVRDASCGV